MFIHLTGVGRNHVSGAPIDTIRLRPEEIAVIARSSRAEGCIVYMRAENSRWEVNESAEEVERIVLAQLDLNYRRMGELYGSHREAAIPERGPSYTTYDPRPRTARPLDNEAGAG